MVRVSSPAKLRPWSELIAKMVMGVRREGGVVHTCAGRPQWEGVAGRGGGGNFFFGAEMSTKKSIP